MTDWVTDPERTLVRIVEDIGKILGVDGREYELRDGDIVTLPSTNADPLLATAGAGPVDEETSAADARPASLQEAEVVAGAEPPTRYAAATHPDHDDLLAHRWEFVDWVWAQAQAKYEKANEKKNVDLLAAAMGDPDEQAKIASTTSGQPSTSPSSSSSTKSSGPAMPESALPLGALEHLSHADRKRAAKKRGLTWPSTRDARDRLFATMTEVMRHEDSAVVDAPTSLGKSYTVATTPWNADSTLSEVTGDSPVIHLQATRDARDEAIEAAADAGLDWFALQSRHEACPVAAGDHDPHPEEDDDREVITIGGVPASEWLEARCDGQGLPFSAAHRHLEKHNDQGTKLPCCRGSPTTYDKEEGEFDEGEEAECPAIAQWEEWRDRRDGLDVVFATHNFAHVPGLRMGTNVILDEEPDFVQDLTKERVERAITAYLQEIDAPVQNWETFVALADVDGWGDDAAKERDQLQHALDQEPDREAYFDNHDLHTLAPALARAIFHAEERGNGRKFGKTPHEPPRLDAGAVDEEGWNREWVSVVMTEANELRTVRCAPDFSQTRSVVGLDAHPARPKWMVNVHPAIQIKQVLESDERQLWRRFERGLRVVQVGDATRPLASGEYYQDQQVRALADHLVDEYGHHFRTAITTKAVESQVEQALVAAGCTEPSTMHYGEEKSRNDFAHERVGLVNGCIDPGDDFVLDLLAELDQDAEPERSESGDRAHGRGFVGADAETATEILASVRENHTAQAAGRYARNPEDPDSFATVFVRTDAMPPGFADVQTPGVVWTFTGTQEEIVTALRDAPRPKSAKELAEEVGCSKRHVQKTLARLHQDEEDDFLSPVQTFEGAGSHGATLYADSGLPNSGVVDVDIANDRVKGSNTWSFAIRDADTAVEDDSPASTAARGESTPWNWREVASNGGDGPPDGGDTGGR